LIAPSRNPLFDRIYANTESQLKYPKLIDKKLSFKGSPGPPVDKTLKEILAFVSVMTGMETDVYGNAPYKERFYLGYLANVEQKCDIFSMDGGVLEDIYYSAYTKTAYEFKKEIEETSQKSLAEVCEYMTDREGFVEELIESLAHTVTLPSDVASVEELIEHAREYYTARAVTNTFVKSVRVIKEMPGYYSCLQCWVCGANETQNCSACKVAAFCCRSCIKKAWKKNHKVLCLHYQRVMNYAETQCKRIDRAFKESFIAPGESLLQPHQFLDYTMVITTSAMAAQDPEAKLDEDTVSVNNFYRNVVRVEQDDKAFRTLFKKGDQVNSSPTVPSLTNVCVGLMFSGNPPGMLPAPKVTRNTFLQEYKNVNGYVKNSEEMVKASVIEDLMRVYRGEDFSKYPDEVIKSLQQNIRDLHD